MVLLHRLLDEYISAETSLRWSWSYSGHILWCKRAKSNEFYFFQVMAKSANQFTEPGLTSVVRLQYLQFLYSRHTAIWLHKYQVSKKILVLIVQYWQTTQIISLTNPACTLLRIHGFWKVSRRMPNRQGASWLLFKLRLEVNQLLHWHLEGESCVFERSGTAAASCPSAGADSAPLPANQSSDGGVTYQMVGFGHCRAYDLSRSRASDFEIEPEWILQHLN